MNLLRRSVVLALVGGLSLCGPAALGAPLSGGSSGRVTAVAARMGTISALPSQAGRISAARDRTVGHWRVTPQGDGSFTISWTSPDPLPITDARPTFERDGHPYAVPELGRDGATLRVDVQADSQGDAPDPASLDVVLSGRTLDAPAKAAPVGPSVVAPQPGTTSLTPDPGVPGSHPVDTRSYQLPGVKMPGMPARIEMLGHVVWPTDVAPGSAPLVLFLHGRHNPCYRTPGTPGPRNREWPCPRNSSPVPSHLGYDYIQQLLAGQGYATVSISANGINAQDWRLVDGGAAARSRLIQEHLDAWADPSLAARIGPAVGLSDLGDVILVGHSRGGEGANRASAEIPLSAPYRISGQILIGPTDFGRQSAPYVPTVTMLPYCDGDVVDLQGQTFTDVARDYAPGDTALHSSLMVLGANHNFFNTEWTPGLSVAPSFDDWFSDGNGTCSYGTPSRLTKTEQQAVGKSYIAGAVALMANGEDAVLPLFDGSRVSLASAGDTDVRSHAVGLGRDTRAPGRDLSLVPGLAHPATAQICVGLAGSATHARWCGRGQSSVRTPHWPGTFPAGAPTRNAVEVSWDATGQQAGMRFRRTLDLSGRSLHLRTIADPTQGTAHLTVRMVDSTGTAAETDVPALRPMPPGPFVLSKRWAQDVIVDSADIDPALGVDLTRIREVDLVSRDTGGRVWVLDVAAGDSTAPTPPVTRVGRLSLGKVTVLERDASGVREARLPFHIAGDVSRPTHFRLAPAGFFGVSFGHPIDFVVGVGVRNGTIAVPYHPNRRDDLRRVFDVAAYGISGAMPTNYTGRVVIVDDDPTPTIRVRAHRSQIREGWTARWTVRLSKPVGYYDGAFVTVRPGPRHTPGLRVSDVPLSWARQHLNPRGPDQPLDRVRLFWAGDVRPGQRELTFTLPIRRDHLREGVEHVTVQVRLLHARARGTSTVQVLDALPR